MSKPAKLLNEDSATLNIKVNKSTSHNKYSLVLLATNDTVIESIEWIHLDKTTGYQACLEDSCKQVIYPFNEITIESNGVTKKFVSEDGFDVINLYDYVLEIEKEARSLTNLCGGIDLHHIFFEGLHLEGDVYVAYWGS